MKASDWVCPHCGGRRIKTSEKYLVCGAGCGRLHDILLLVSQARKFDYKRFQIPYEEGYWERIPLSDRASLDTCPPLGVVVARAPSGRVCAFRQAKPPRQRVRNQNP
jgi:hypothetical protein